VLTFSVCLCVRACLGGGSPDISMQLLFMLNVLQLVLLI